MVGLATIHNKHPVIKDVDGRYKVNQMETWDIERRLSLYDKVKSPISAPTFCVTTCRVGAHPTIRAHTTGDAERTPQPLDQIVNTLLIWRFMVPHSLRSRIINFWRIGSVPANGPIQVDEFRDIANWGFGSLCDLGMQRTYFTPQNHTWYAYVTEATWNYGDNF
ncbi:uncharacterized protein BKA55DRAFT_728299 [Fusarium redolens]|uniref:Uncharacterized protein n=1 Tax=Fusarium redolens TaxID=48865 RepID=A0A9P9H366_FUSRE|nr:uncharacterized protein BKA55DRAFT_728299 [Fusarium redolens]KAH7250186.1 hypothetical protein BKA55DRAFT_728299 [Fusarium redolens]